MASYEVALTDKAGQVRAFVEAHDLKHTRRLGNLGPCELSFWLDLDGDDASEATPGNRLVRVYRDGTLVFHGVLWPVVQNADESQGKVSVTAFDPSAILEHRFLQASNQLTWNNTDQGTIARNLVNDQAGVGGAAWYPHLEALAGDVQTSVKRDRTYDIGKQVLEAVRELGEVDDGFYFRVDPVAYDSAWDFGSTGLKQVAAGELNVLWPASGVEREELRFEYGEGTRDTARSIERTIGLPTNEVMAIGEQGGIRAQSASDDVSQTEYGVWMEAPTFSDVRRKTTLRQHAQALLRPETADAEVVTFTPAADGPVLGVDFEVGDIGRLFARRGALSIDARVRVLECEVSIDDDGVELISSLTVERA